MLLAVMHRDLPQSAIGKVYALRMTIASVGVFAGLMLAGPLYNAVPVQAGIGICAAVMATTGIAGFMRFGLARPIAEARSSPQANSRTIRRAETDEQTSIERAGGWRAWMEKTCGRGGSSILAIDRRAESTPVTIFVTLKG